MHDYTQDMEAPNEAHFKRLNLLVRELAEAEDAVLEAEKVLKQKQEYRESLSQQQIPELMEELGLSDFTTTSGIGIKIKSSVKGSISKERNADAIRWLDENGHDGLVKRKFIIEFGREDAPWANKFAADLNKRKRPLNHKQENTVHPSTLCSWATSMLDEGKDFPMDLLGIHVIKQAKITK